MNNSSAGTGQDGSRLRELVERWRQTAAKPHSSNWEDGRNVAMGMCADELEALASEKEKRECVSTGGNTSDSVTGPANGAGAAGNLKAGDSRLPERLRSSDGLIAR